MDPGQGNRAVTGVYVVYRNQIVGDAIQAVLRTHPGISVLGATDDPGLAQAGIIRLSPQVVLLEEASATSPGFVQALLTNPVPCRLVTLRPDRDGMHVWSQQWWANVGPNDLVEAIVSCTTRIPTATGSAGPQARTTGEFNAGCKDAGYSGASSGASCLRCRLT